MGKTKQP